jgi:riboflavin synthase
MFTGIIQTTGKIEVIERKGNDIKIIINAQHIELAEVKDGDSIAVNGVCLTATEITPSHFSAHVSKETLDVTTGLDCKKVVNLEKALRFGDRLGGHLVSGHVDGVGEVTRFESLGDCWLLAIQAPSAISKYIAKKGSICLDGVSLTVNSVVGNNFTLNIIPYTLNNTTLAYLKIGENVNLEIDQTARYLERLTEWTLENN